MRGVVITKNLRGKSKSEKVTSREIKIKALILIKSVIEINLKKLLIFMKVKRARQENLGLDF